MCPRLRRHDRQRPARRGPSLARRPARRYVGRVNSRASLDSQIRFLLEADRLKTVSRQSLISDGSRRENSAEHSWHLALFAVVLAQHAPPGVDLARVMAMVLVHDLVEIDAGDLIVYADAAAQARQAEAERAAADRIFALLPGSQAAAMRSLWDEFEERQTAEARFARALDRLEPLLLNLVVGGGTWTEHHVTADQELAKVELINDGSAELGAYARAVVATAVERGILLPGSTQPA
jgi:5'-deoxynucleotidase YfbR-like HD superfamily hydrolase